MSAFIEQIENEGFKQEVVEKIQNIEKKIKLKNYAIKFWLDYEKYNKDTDTECYSGFIDQLNEAKDTQTCFNRLKGKLDLPKDKLPYSSTEYSDIFEAISCIDHPEIARYLLNFNYENTYYIRDRFILSLALQQGIEVKNYLIDKYKIHINNNFGDGNSNIDNTLSAIITSFVLTNAKEFLNDLRDYFLKEENDLRIQKELNTYYFDNITNWAISNLIDESYNEWIYDILKNRDKYSVSFIKFIIEYIGNIGMEKAIPELIKEFKNYKNSFYSYHVPIALGKLKVEKVIKFLVNHINDPQFNPDLHLSLLAAFNTKKSNKELKKLLKTKNETLRVKVQTIINEQGISL